MLELLNVSPFDESEDAGIVDEAHEMWFSLQAQERILDEGDKNPVVIDPYRRQPAKDQYRVGLGGYKCYRDEVKRNLKKTKEVKPKDTVPEPEPAGGSTPPPSEEKKS
jgi:hypothetical protein